MSQHREDRSPEDLRAYLEELDRLEAALSPADVVALEELNRCELCDGRRDVRVLRNKGRICGTCAAALGESVGQFVRRNGSETQ